MEVHFKLRLQSFEFLLSGFKMWKTKYPFDLKTHLSEYILETFYFVKQIPSEPLMLV